MKDRFKIVNKEFDIQIIFTVLRRNWWIPVLLAAFFWTLAFFYLRYTKPTYQSNIIIQLESKDKAKEVMDIQGIQKDPNDLSYEIELLKSQLLFNKALKTLNLHISLYSKGAVLTEEKYKSSVFNVQPFELRDSSLV
ncbi:MAG: Wzz/FepE/Etk N-terminal domain-containing protein, partial [Crocinitomicaceae bacterium]